MANDRPTERIQIAKPWLPPFEDFESFARDVFERRMLSNFAKYCELLEESAGAVLGCKVSAVSSCDIGMTLAWRALGLDRGQVIVPSFTLGSTVNALVWNGLEPVFADIDPQTLCIANSEIERLLTSDTVGVAAVHVFGEPVSLAVDELAVEHGLALVFDAAHGIGTTQNGASLAQRGDASVFSLSGTKIVTAGEGGIAAFPDPDHRERFELLRSYGFGDDYDVVIPGLNGKLSELNAALGVRSFELLDEMVARRAAIVEQYRSRLEGHRGIALQPRAPEGDTRSYKDVAVIFADEASRAGAERALSDAGIATKRYFRPVHTMTAYRQFAGGPLPATDAAWSRTLCVPVYHDLGETDIDRIADIILAGIG